MRYFTGFDSQFWESPTRPWYLVVPSEGKPVAIIPEIGEAGMRSTWIDDVPDLAGAASGRRWDLAARGESARTNARAVMAASGPNWAVR